MSVHLGLYAGRGGPLLPDDTGRLTRLIVSTGNHGYEACQLSAPMPLSDAFRRYDWPGVPNAIVRADGTIAFDGRAEDVSIHTNGVDMTAFGYQRALSDAPYTALWSDSIVAKWRPLTTDELFDATPDRFTFDIQNRIYITPNQNSTQGGSNGGRMVYQNVSGGSRNIVGISFDYQLFAPVGWEAKLQTANVIGTAWAITSTQWTLAASGALQTGTVNLAHAATDNYSFILDNTGGGFVYLPDTGTHYLKITNVRVVTSTANRVNTTNTAGWVAGANVTINVVSSARMYIGQRLQFNYGATSEVAIVAAVPSSTQVTVANIVTSVGGAGIPIQAHVIYADEIVKDIVSTVSTLNSTQLSSNTALIQSPALDLFDELYEDELPSTVLDRLIGLGDSATLPRRWEWGVYNNQQVHFRPENSAALAWYVDISDIDLQRTIEQLINSAYAVYQEASNRTLRGASATDADSVARFGLTRRQAVKATTTSLTQANVQRDGVIDDKANPVPRFGISFDKIFTAAGAVVPIWLPRAGDTITIRNLPPTISVDIDQVRTFRIARTSCDLIARTLTVEPAVPLPTMAALIARGLRGQTT